MTMWKFTGVMLGLCVAGAMPVAAAPAFDSSGNGTCTRSGLTSGRTATLSTGTSTSRTSVTFLTMECFRRAMCATNNADAAARMHRSAALMSRLMADTVKNLETRRLRHAGGKTP